MGNYRCASSSSSSLCLMWIGRRTSWRSNELFCCLWVGLCASHVCLQDKGRRQDFLKKNCTLSANRMAVIFWVNPALYAGTDPFSHNKANEFSRCTANASHPFVPSSVLALSNSLSPFCLPPSLSCSLMKYCVAAWSKKRTEVDEKNIEPSMTLGRGSWMHELKTKSEAKIYDFDSRFNSAIG